jgi:cytochrome c
MIEVVSRVARLPALFAILSLAVTAGSRAAPAPEALQGRAVFQSNCAICHTVQPNRSLIGPSLFGVVNRPAGQMPGFHYSDANRRSGLVWNPATLDRYLAAPREVVPGTFMTFPGLKDPSQRAEVIAFLETLH